jgi:hypothetical protein
MKPLSNREILGELRVLGLSKKKDLFLYFILYKSYFSLNYCRTFKQIKGLKKLVDNCLRRFDRLNICYTYSPVPITTQTAYSQRQEKYRPSAQ